MKIFIAFCLTVLLLTLSGCSASLIYSTSACLPAHRFEKSEVDIQGGLEWMPEARPDAIGGSPLTSAITGRIGYGVSKTFSLFAKYWVEVQHRATSPRVGFLAGSQFLKSFLDRGRLIVMPQFGLASQDLWTSGVGGGVSLLYQYDFAPSSGCYLGTGFYLGFQDFTRTTNPAGRLKMPMGWAMINHFGVALEFIKNTRINVELCPIFQFNTFEEKSHFILSPHFGVGYTFRTKSQPSD